MKNDKNTSWGSVADWYDDAVEKKDSYQTTLILPNVLRMAGDLKAKRVLDLACGQGLFAEAFVKLGADVVGSDISPELIQIAKNRSGEKAKFYVSPADKLDFAKEGGFDLVTIILALQNIQNIPGVFSELKRVVKKGGNVLLVLNHPAFRIPKRSEWGWDEKNKIQYRRLDSYISESAEEILMSPGSGSKSPKTFSFHRPIQYYFKIFAKFGFYAVRLEEWTSDKTSGPGFRQYAENRARKEFPLFLAVVLEKN